MYMKSYTITKIGIKQIPKVASPVMLVEGPIDSVSLYVGNRYVCLVSLYNGGLLAFQAEDLNYEWGNKSLRLFLKI